MPTQTVVWDSLVLAAYNADALLRQAVRGGASVRAQIGFLLGSLGITLPAAAGFRPERRHAHLEPRVVEAEAEPGQAVKEAESCDVHI